MTTQRHVIAGTVTVHEVADVFRPKASRSTHAVEWRPGLKAIDLLPGGWDRALTEVGINGVASLGGGWDVPLARGDAVTLIRRPGWTFVGAVLVQIAIAVLMKVLFPPEKPRTPENNSDPVYGWSGVRSNYNADGLPLRLHYGEHKTGGDVVSIYTEVIDGDTPQTYLWLLLALGAGPFYSIGQYTSDQDELTGDDLPNGLKLQGNSAKNFDEITCWLRMGTLTQDPVPGFDAIRTQYSVDLLVDQVTDMSGAPPVIDWSMSAAYDMASGDAADSVVIGLSFPGGLYRIDSTGDIYKEQVDLQVRYTELDDDGNPVGDPVVANFGFDTTLLYKVKQTNAFTKQLTVPLYDPATYMAPTLSNALTFSASNKHWGRTYAAPVLAPEWVTDAVVDELSMVAVVQVRASQAANVVWGNRTLVSSIFNKGIRVALIELVSGESQLQVLWGTGTTTDALFAGSVLDDVPVQIACTYRAGVGAGGTNRMRIFVDGQMVAEKLSTVAMKMPAAGFWWNAVTGSTTGSAASNFAQLDHDEFRLFNRELTPDQILALHKDGEWESGVASDAGLVLGFHHDQVVTAGSLTYSPSYVPGQPDMELLGNSGVPSAIAGFVTNTFGNTLKRGRYRIEVQRTDAVKEDGNNHDTVRFDHLITVLHAEIAYAGTTLVALRMLATDQLSGGQPNVTVVAKGVRECPVWDGFNPDAPTFALQYSDNPADQLAHLLLDVDNGAGNYFSVTDIDWTSWKYWREQCAAWVYDQRGAFTGSAVAYAASAFGFDGAVLKVTLPTPRPVHLVVGKTVRLSDFAAGASDYPEGEYAIGQIVPVDDDTYQLWFDWPADSAAPADTDVADAEAVTLQGVEGRHECHIILADRDLKMWDAAQLIASVGRAYLVRLGDKLRVIYDGPRDPVALFTPANIVADTFKLTTLRIEETFNSAVAEIQGRDLDWERNPIPRDHSSLTDAANTSKVRRRVFDMRGVTKTSQALRDLDYRLEVNDKVQLGCEFEAALDATFLEPGDVFVLTHPMPAWASGGKAAADSADESHLAIDVPVTIGSKNLLSKTASLGTLAQWARTGTNAPTLFSSVEPGPDGVADAAVFDFGAVQSVLRYARAIKDGQVYGASVYAKVKDGLGTVTLDLNVDNGAGSVTVADDGEWHRVSVTATAGSANFFDIECISRRVALHWAQLERTEVTDYEGVDVASTDTYSVAVRDDDTDAVNFAAVDPAEWGAYAAGEVLLLDEALPSVPRRGWIWALGPYAEASLQFQVTDTTLTADFRRRISGLQYVPAVYPDGDGFADLPLSVGGPGDTLASTTGGGLTLASLASTLTVTEEAARDPNTGALSLSLVVSWRHDPETVQGIERTAIWLAQDGDSDPDQVGEVRGSGSSFRIEGIARRLPVGTVFRVWVQPVTRGGVRRSLRRCRSVAVSILGLFPVPTEAPTAGSVTLAGDQATYRVTLPGGFSDRIIELWSGQPFIGQAIGRIPVGGDSLPLTYQWSQLPTAADGRGNVPLVARLVGVNGARGDFIRVDSELAPTGFGAPLLEASFEDGPFDTAPAGFSEAPVLTNLQLVTGRPSFVAQRLSWSGSALTASYDSTVFDLGAVKRVHISAGFSGRQVAAETMAELRYPISSQYMRSWTPEGFTDPSHPLYGKIGCELQWAHSEDSADPGTDYEPFVPGLSYVRSCRFRLALTRPTADWDVLLDRFAVSVRPMRGVNRELLMQDGVTSPPVPLETEDGSDWIYGDD